jgi:hypothetical protein
MIVSEKGHGLQTKEEPLTETSPLAELLAIGNLDQGDLVLGAQGNDELLVRLLLASLVQDAHVGLSSVKGLGCFAETAGETVVDEGELQDSLEGVEDGHLSLGGLCRDFDLLGSLGSVVLFYVRLQSKKLETITTAQDRITRAKLAGQTGTSRVRESQET